MKLLSREEFEKQVFKKSNGKCVFCENKAVDAHHILDRKLFNDGGYYVENGAAVCEAHHFECELTAISVEETRKAAGSHSKVLPPKFSNDMIYDKWGNLINDDGSITSGPLIDDKGCQTMLKRSGKISLILVPLDQKWC